MPSRFCCVWRNICSVYYTDPMQTNLICIYVCTIVVHASCLAQSTPLPPNPSLEIKQHIPSAPSMQSACHICISFQLHCFQLPFHLCILLTGLKLKLYSNSSNTHEVYIIAQIITTPPYNIYICTSFCINPIALPFFAYLSL